MSKPYINKDGANVIDVDQIAIAQAQPGTQTADTIRYTVVTVQGAVVDVDIDDPQSFDKAVEEAIKHRENHSHSQPGWADICKCSITV